MAKISKRFKEVKSKVDNEKLYNVSEALDLVKETAVAKFDESIEVAYRLNVDPRQADHNIRGALVMPNGTGKTQIVAVVCKGDKIKEAEAAGADFAGDTELIAKIEKGWLGFDVLVATPDMMGQLGRLGRVLGPKGLMPNPKTGTVTPDVTKAVKEVKAGKIEYRVDKVGNVHVQVGKASFSKEDLLGNIRAIHEVILKVKPASAKGVYIQNLSVSATMGPGIKVDNLTIIE